MTEEETQQIPQEETSEAGNVSESDAKIEAGTDEAKEEVSEEAVKEEPVSQ
ncbi:MAG: hypothetical protein WCX73_00930 [Candidatus Pacearchaeota archaeon]|jgi:hypothetical protein